MSDRVELSEIIEHLKNKRIISSVKVVSFVGPMPELPFIVEQYDEIYKERLVYNF